VCVVLRNIANLCSAAQYISLIVNNVAKKNLGPKKEVKVEWKKIT